MKLKKIVKKSEDTTLEYFVDTDGRIQGEYKEYNKEDLVCVSHYVDDMLHGPVQNIPQNAVHGSMAGVLSMNENIIYFIYDDIASKYEWNVASRKDKIKEILK